MSELHDKIRMAQVTAAEMVVLQDMHDKGLCADYCPACKQEDAPSHPQDPAHAILAELAQITCLSLPQQIEQAAFDLSDRAKALLSTSPPQDPRDEALRAAREALEKLAPVVIGNYQHAAYGYIRKIKDLMGEK